MTKTISIISVLLLGQVTSAVGAGDPVWRFWSPVLERHFYTVSEAERDYVLAYYDDVWTYEGVSYNAHAFADSAGLTPVYRFWSEPLAAHFYTISVLERDFVIETYPGVWTYEGVAFYAYPDNSPPTGTLPVYRFWSDKLGAHFYTAEGREQFSVAYDPAGVWTYEGVAWYAHPADSTGPAMITKGPYLVWPDTDSTTVMWETDTAATSRVDYGVTSPSEAFAESTEPTTLHKVRLTGLAAGTNYVYRVTSGQAVSSVGNFTATPSADQPFRLAVYGDTRSNPAAHRRVVDSIVNSVPDLVLHTGDLIATGRDYGLWSSEFFSPAENMLLTTPIIPVLGNHEYNGTGPLWYFYFFDVPYGAGWFALTYGNTRFIGLDTDVSFASGSPQHEWLLGELSSTAYSSATWKVVFYHHPAFTASIGHSDDPAVKSHLVPLFESHGVDIVFQGHSHTYERYLNNGIYYIVTGGGGGPLQPLTPDFTQPRRQFGRTVHHHCVVDVDATTLTMMVIDTDGQVFDTVQLQQ